MKKDDKNFLPGYSQFLDDSGEHLTYSALSMYRNFSEELSKKERIFFKRHLESCPDCSTRLQEIADIEGHETEKQKKTTLIISPGVFRYAIAAMLIVAVGFTIIFIIQDFQREKIVSKDVSFEKSLAAIETDPSKFIPNQVLENFIKRAVRSSSGVSLTAPALGDTITTPFTFKWDGQKNGNFTLTIVDNKNVEKCRKTISSTEFILENRLEPGLYYVKLEADEKLVRIGMFVVIR
jgi:hypothetical protein